MDRHIWRLRDEVATALAGLVQELHAGGDPLALDGADDEACDMLAALGLAGGDAAHALDDLAVGAGR